MANAGKKAAFLLGRTILGGFFIQSGLNHFKQRRELAKYAAAKKVPLPGVAVPLTGAMLVAGGASLLLGLKPRIGVLPIIGFFLGVSPVMHDFWNDQDASQRQNNEINFWKNMALLGATVALAGAERWPLSVAAGDKEEERRTERRRGMLKGAA